VGQGVTQMSKSVQVFNGPLQVPHRSLLRLLTASILRRASRILSRTARRVGSSSARRHLQRPPELEFYAEAGAPEGALFVNGEFVGTLPGVTRL
jgi:hypothetical protein